VIIKNQRIIWGWNIILLNVKARGIHSYHIERNYGKIRSYEHLNSYRVATTDSLLSNCYVRLSIANRGGGGGGGGGALSHLSQRL
jgi:hypothetical protein